MPISITKTSRRTLLRRTMILLAATIATTGVLAGCGGGGGGGGSSSTTVTGVVKDSATGDDPVQGVTISIGGVEGKTLTVDQANTDNPVGSFRLTNVPTGTGSAIITLTDGSKQTVSFRPTVGAGVNPALELFINIGQLSGKVLLPNGQPAASAYVTVSATGETVSTSPDGSFFIQLVPQGATQLFAVQGTATATKEVTLNYGDNPQGDITLVDDPNPNPPGLPYTIIGKITQDGGTALSGTTVFLFRNGVQIESGTTGTDGQYTFYVPVGQYTIRASRSGFQDANGGPLNVTDPTAPVRADLNMTSL